MYRYLLYFGGYTAVIGAICLNNYRKGANLYQTLVGLVENRIQHFLLCTFFVVALYSIGRLVINTFIGKLSTLEIEGIQENILRYLGNVCLIMTLFADNVTLKILLAFTIVLGLKIMHWAIGMRIESIEKGGEPGRNLNRILELCLFLFLLDGMLMYKTLGLAIKEPGVSILFGFEFSLLFAYSVRCMYSLLLLYQCNDKTIEEKIFLLFYGDLVFGLFKILAHIWCLAWTTIHFRMPINLFRECIIVSKQLGTRIKTVMAYKALLEELKACPNATEEELAQNKVCLICHEDMDVAKKLECSHFFHMDCLKEWLHRQQACPICRKEVVPKKGTMFTQFSGSSTSNNSTTQRQTAPRETEFYFSDGITDYEAMPVSIQGTPR
ncbi:E3 ubiquitin-protein ligase synoviolin [Nematocida sp. AWRm80]|nr:E3 ubiquitin-protein ligase synoviolin [Nematocida sp. AWRm80]